MLLKGYMIPNNFPSLKNIDAILVDIRGTIIHPSLDEPLSPKLVQITHALAKAGVKIGVDTATSIQSMKNLILEPLLTYPNSTVDDIESNFVMYVDSSTAAYSLKNKDIIPLNEYEFLSFEEDELASVLKNIEQAIAQYELSNATYKVKAGQINFYCGGTWEERMIISDSLNKTLHKKGYKRIAAMVPSAKETIDIAICKKDRGAEDFIRRFQLAPQNILIIGDSLQDGAPDLDMVKAAPGSIGIQVGPYIPHSKIYHLSHNDATMAAYEILKHVLEHKGIFI